jgi:hypothetical protein
MQLLALRLTQILTSVKRVIFRTDGCQQQREKLSARR